MPVPVVAATNSGNVTSSVTDVPVGEPGTTISGDVVAIGVVSDDTNHAADLWDNVTLKPLGFTLIDQAGLTGQTNLDVSTGVFLKVIDGTESWPITCTAGEAGRQSWVSARVTGVNNSAPLDGSGTPYEPNGTGATHDVTGFTTSEDDCLAFTIFGGDGGDTGPHTFSGSWASEVQDSQGSGPGVSISLSSLGIATAGATGTNTVSFAGSIDDGGAGLQFTFAPAGADTEDDLLADDVQSTSEITSPNVGQEHTLAANDVQSLSQVDSPVVGQEHILLADDTESASEITTPTASESHILLSVSVESNSEISIPLVGQAHVLDANDIQSTSEISNPAISQEHIILAADIESASEVSISAIKQVHIFDAVNIQSLSEVSAPVLTELSGDILLADDVESASEVNNPALIEIYVFSATNAESASEVSIPAFWQEHVISADDIQSLSELSLPALFENAIFEWIEQCPDDAVWTKHSASSGSWLEAIKDDSDWVEQSSDDINTKRCS